MIEAKHIRAQRETVNKSCEGVSNGTQVIMEMKKNLVLGFYPDGEIF